MYNDYHYDKMKYERLQELIEDMKHVHGIDIGHIMWDNELKGVLKPYKSQTNPLPDELFEL